jgi:hypothetical protein
MDSLLQILYPVPAVVLPRRVCWPAHRQNATELCLPCVRAPVAFNAQVQTGC